MTLSDAPGRESVEDLWRLYSAISDWIKFADAKAGVILAGGGLLAGLVLREVVNQVSRPSTNPWLVGLSMGTIVFAAVASVCSILVLWPRLAKKEQATSLIYFEHIARRYEGDRQSFRKAMTAALEDDNGLAGELLDQIWVLARIARRKLLFAAAATRYLALTLIVGSPTWLLALVAAET